MDRVNLTNTDLQVSAMPGYRRFRHKKEPGGSVPADGHFYGRRGEFY